MTSARRRFGGLVLVLALLGSAQAATPPASVRQLRLDVVVADDGTAVQTLHLETAVRNDAAARREAQLAMPFSEAIERLELLEAYTQRPDGTRIPVAPGAVRTQLAPGVPNVPAFSDRQQKVAVFPDAQGGDLLVSTWRRTITHPLFPGQFTHTSLFSRTLPWEDVSVTISTPAGKPLRTETHGPVLDQSTTADGRHSYQWHYSAPDALAEDAAALSPLDRAPRLFASTFADWASFSREYASLFVPQAAVTHRVQILADEVTSGTSDRREQARLLYEWVSRHIRWGAIYLGNGTWIPHTANEVLENGMGDCKDQVALFIALLQAKGIAGEPVLINLLPSYTLSDPAVTNAFNHAITYLPEWRLYADTTSGQAQFGTLTFAEYGKPILHVVAGGSAPATMAPLAPAIATERLHTMATLGSDGVVTGTTTNEASGPFATALRLAARTIEGMGAEQAAARQLGSLRQPGHGSFTLPATDALEQQYRVEGKFTLDAHPEWVEGDSFAIPTGLRLLTRTGDLLIGPMTVENLPVAERTPCYAGREEEELTLALPPGYRLERLPNDITLNGSFFRYESRWGFADGAVTVRRTLGSRLEQPLCQDGQRVEAAKALTDIRRDLNARIRLTKAAE